jgi:hypothetical protein
MLALVVLTLFFTVFHEWRFSMNGSQSKDVAERLELRLEAAELAISGFARRLAALERKVFSHNRHRWDLIEKIADYFRGAQVAGDYAEFGVFRGETFAHACKFMAPWFRDMHFWAFDSFEGLPAPRSSADVDPASGYSGGFFQGQFTCSEAAFHDYLSSQEVDMAKVHTVAGWFSETLLAEAPASHRLRKVALAWIDCDLYESTVPVLDFLTDKLSVGTVLVFDDWRCFRNLDDFGQRKACQEWLERNPHIQLNLLIDNDYNGYAFSVAAVRVPAT